MKSKNDVNQNLTVCFAKGLLLEFQLHHDIGKLDKLSTKLCKYPYNGNMQYKIKNIN